jgi:hypothetical protein
MAFTVDGEMIDGHRIVDREMVDGHQTEIQIGTYIQCIVISMLSWTALRYKCTRVVRKVKYLMTG